VLVAYNEIASVTSLPSTVFTSNVSTIVVPPFIVFVIPVIVFANPVNVFEAPVIVFVDRVPLPNVIVPVVFVYNVILSATALPRNAFPNNVSTIVVLPFIVFVPDEFPNVIPPVVNEYNKTALDVKTPCMVLPFNVLIRVVSPKIELVSPFIVVVDVVLSPIVRLVIGLVYSVTLLDELLG